MTIAMIGHGSAFSIGDSGGTEVFTAVAEVFSITPPVFRRDVVDATHMGSAERFREFIPGLIDPGEVTIQLNFDPGGSAQTSLFAKLNTGASNYRITYPDATIWTFSAFMTGFNNDDPLDGKLTATATFKLTGKPAYVS